LFHALHSNSSLHVKPSAKMGLNESKLKYSEKSRCISIAPFIQISLKRIYFIRCIIRL